MNISSALSTEASGSEGNVVDILNLLSIHYATQIQGTLVNPFVVALSLQELKHPNLLFGTVFSFSVRPW